MKTNKEKLHDYFVQFLRESENDVVLSDDEFNASHQALCRIFGARLQAIEALLTEIKK